MQLDEISCENFRAKQAVSLKLGRRLTLLIGENGAGKTTILDAIAIACGAIFRYLPDKNNNSIKGISFRKGDILQQDGREFPYTFIKATCTNNGPKWDLMRKRDSNKSTEKKVPKKREGFRDLQQHIEAKIVKPWNEKKDFDLPIITYYGVNRALISMPQRRRNFGKNHSRFAALADSLNATSRFRSAFIWVYNKEDEERRLQQEKRDFDVKLPELEAVRRCICELLPYTSNLRTARPLRFLVTYHGQDLEINQLSDGYKTTLGLAIDLSTRMAAANPHMDNPLETEAIVLIDEVDLHLHPIWQQRIISDLLRIFPNTQFVLTSHSPILVEGVNNLLKRHAIDHLLAKTPSESIASEVENLYPLDPKDTKVYDVTRDPPEGLLDQDEGLTGDTLIENFNDVSAIFEHMCDFEEEEGTSLPLSLEENAP